LATYRQSKGVEVVDTGQHEIRFYSHHEEPYGCFSSFSPHGFELDGLWWPTSEHYFQAQKFPDNPYSEKIRAANSPMTAATLGRSRKQPVRSDWAAVKDDVMSRAVLCKFSTNSDFKKVLLSTGNAILIEATSDDYYWGCGTNGTGLNMLGKILMEVRQQLAKRE